MIERVVKDGLQVTVRVINDNLWSHCGFFLPDRNHKQKVNTNIIELSLWSFTAWNTQSVADLKLSCTQWDDFDAEQRWTLIVNFNLLIDKAIKPMKRCGEILNKSSYVLGRRYYLLCATYVTREASCNRGK